MKHILTALALIATPALAAPPPIITNPVQTQFEEPEYTPVSIAQDGESVWAVRTEDTRQTGRYRGAIILTVPADITLYDKMYIGVLFDCTRATYTAVGSTAFKNDVVIERIDKTDPAKFALNGSNIGNAREAVCNNGR